MHRHKKILLGLTALALSLLAVSSWSQKALAAQATVSDGDQCSKTLRYTDYAHIVCDTSFGIVTFTDRNPTDDIFNYDYSSNQIFCTSYPGSNTATVKYVRGISSERGQVQLSEAGNSISAILNVGIINPTNPTASCVKYDGEDGKNVTITNTSRLDYIYQFSGTSIASLPGVSNGSLAGDSFPLISDYNAGNASTGLSILGFAGSNWQACGIGEVVNIIRTSGGVDSAVGSSYVLVKGNGTLPNNDLFNLLVAFSVTGCTAVPVNLIDDSQRQVSFRVLGTPPVVAPGTKPVPGGDGSGSTGTETCEKQGFVMAWALCPILRGLDATIGFIDEQIRDLLEINTDQYFSKAAPDNGVYKVWTIIRNLAASLLIIVMLVMIISQAFSWGPLDAYTIRKILPRLVAAVIIIQISWELVVWLINVTNDAGNGLAEIMYFPFGGIDAMNLDDIVAKANIGAAGQIGTLGLFGTAIAGGLVAAVVVGGAGSILVGLLLLAVLAAIAILIGFLVLVFRQILIILCVMLVPLALLAWILPGTERYWKLWRETFTKLLLMFPLIVGILAAGKIFAKAVATPGDGGLLVFFLILIGVFAPYIILPKTFQWGGAIMGSLSRGLATGANRLGSPLTKPVRGLYSDTRARSRWTLSRQQRKGELDRMARLGQAEGLQEGGASGGLNRARLLGFRRPRTEGQIQRRITEGSLAALEADMLPQVQKENVDHLNGYLLTQAMDGTVQQRVATAVTRMNASRTQLGLPPATQAEIDEMTTNFGRFDTNGWRNNRTFASSAVQATGGAGSLNADAERAARAVYVGDRTGEEAAAATARFGAIQFKSHVAARSAGQYASDEGSLGVETVAVFPPLLPNGQPHPNAGQPNPAYDPHRPGAEWRRVSDASQVGFGSIANYVGGSNANTGVGRAMDDGITAGQFDDHATFEYRDPSGNAVSFTGIRFNDPEIQNFIKEAARIRAGQRNLDARQREQWNREYGLLMARLGPQAGVVEQTISEMAGRRQFID